jgi:spore photoproduct lyase
LTSEPVSAEPFTATARPPTLWRPARVLVTRAAAALPFGAQIITRCEAAGVGDIQLLSGDRLPSLRAGDERATYALAKRTLAVVVAPPSKRRLQPIPPSADWRIDLAEGCPGHCQYCYLAGSLSGPPITRVYANLPEILAGLDQHVGRGAITSASTDRAGEGTTFEASCYTDPLALEHLTGSLSTTIRHFGERHWDGPVGLRFTTKYDHVDPLVGLPHGGRTRVRVSVNAEDIAGRFEGGTARLPQRITALQRLASAGYRVGLTIAPIMPIPGWRDGYGALLRDVADALPDATDLTVECITHRFTAGSKDVLTGWYPQTKLDMEEASRTRKFGKYGSAKFVYPKDTMAELRAWFTTALAQTLPTARLLYWT